MAVSQEASSYDVHKTTTLIARQVFAGTVWEKLVTLNANSEVIPELCSSYEMSEDACTFTFHLREGVKFHDGSTLSAEGGQPEPLDRCIQQCRRHGGRRPL